MVSVKQERPDEPEIRELAAKMKEAYNAKMAPGSVVNNTASTGRPQIVGSSGQSSLLNYVIRSGNQTSAPTKPAASLPEDKKLIDEDSQRGRFGWVTLGPASIPYIVRYGEKYCAVRIVETRLLNKFLSYLHSDIYSYTNIRSYYITDAEARILNDINLRHCEAKFSRDHFVANKDVVVRLQDASEFYTFLEVCYNKLNYSSCNPKDRCGFIRINNESVVPYTLKDDTKCVPLFYFEGETESLKLKANTLEGWDLAYLKFCCKVQGIRNELFASETCSVISLDDIKNYFPVGTKFDDYWPPKMVDSQLITKNPVANASWTRQPSGVPPAAVAKPAAPPQRSCPSALTPPVAGTPGPAPPLPAAVMNNWSSGPMLHQQHPAMVSQQNAIARMASTLQNSLSNSNPPYSQMRNWPVHTTAASSSYYYPQVPQMTMPMQQQKTYPPPLVRSAPTSNSAIASMTGGSVSIPDSRSYAAALQKQQMQQQQQQARTQNNATLAQRYNGFPGSDVMDLSSQQQQQYSSSLNGRPPNMMKKKLIPIEDAITSGAHTPYQVQKALVDNIMVPCINAVPYRSTDQLLMTLPDLCTHFFPHTAPSDVIKILQDVLNINLYIGNRQQMEVLRLSGKCTDKEPIPLIQVRDVMQYMPQLKYVLIKNNQLVAESPQAKRQRMS